MPGFQPDPAPSSILVSFKCLSLDNPLRGGALTPALSRPLFGIPVIKWLFLTILRNCTTSPFPNCGTNERGRADRCAGDRSAIYSLQHSRFLKKVSRHGGHDREIDFELTLKRSDELTQKQNGEAST